ncbi:hypothetical protein ATCC90586_003632 [Pythium insidiosum]|nr:hypothetical protein ATCC90586_003632 [Pythium insidiosum]
MLGAAQQDPALQLAWSPMTKQGQERFDCVRAAIRAQYQSAPPSSRGAPATATISPQMQRLRQRVAAAASKSSDDIFFQSFGAPAQLMRRFNALKPPASSLSYLSVSGFSRPLNTLTNSGATSFIPRPSSVNNIPTTTLSTRVFALR